MYKEWPNENCFCKIVPYHISIYFTYDQIFINFVVTLRQQDGVNPNELNANDATLFSQYGMPYSFDTLDNHPIDGAINYFKIEFTPYIHLETSTPYPTQVSLLFHSF